RHPASPLFPYTTLFRSRGDHNRQPSAQARQPAGQQRVILRVQTCERLIQQEQCRTADEGAPQQHHASLAVGELQEPPPGKEPYPDRKSTRLNSSHLVIS